MLQVKLFYLKALDLPLIKRLFITVGRKSPEPDAAPPVAEVIKKSLRAPKKEVTASIVTTTSIYGIGEPYVPPNLKGVKYILIPKKPNPPSIKSKTKLIMVARIGAKIGAKAFHNVPKIKMKIPTGIIVNNMKILAVALYSNTNN